MGSHGSNDNNTRMWEWTEEDFSLQRDPELDIHLWDETNQRDNNFLYMLEEEDTQSKDHADFGYGVLDEEDTPSKDYADLGYGVFDAGDKTNKGMEEHKGSSQLKRRRRLLFSSDVDDIGTGNEQISSTSESSKVMVKSFIGDELLKCLEWEPEWSSSFSDDRRSFDRERLGQTSEASLANCFGEMSSSMNDSVASSDQVEALVFNKVSCEMENIAVKKDNNPAFCRVFRGTKSYMKTPTKLSTTIAYPFTLVKPCGIQGDVTLKDINQMIHSPPPSKSNTKVEDPLNCYPTSAITGKPVVIKTKIRTEGGKGSITIMRTKG